MGSISSNVQNDLEGSLIIYIRGRDIHRGILVNFHQKLVVYYILGNFGILFILDINSVLIEFILWIRDFIRDSFEKYSEGLRYC